MKAHEVSMIMYREIEGWADNVKDDIFNAGDACVECRHYKITYNDPDRGGRLTHCNAKSALECPEVYKVIGHLADDLSVALQEIDFD